MDFLGRVTCFLLFFIVSRSLPACCCPELCNCPLGEVNCTRKALQCVPENMTLRIITLLLAYNEITALSPHSLRGLELLQHLELQHNRISSLNIQAFEGLASLRYLDLSCNQIVHLEAGTLNPLTSLTTLNLGNNKIRSLDSGAFKKLSLIRDLFLHNNALRVLGVNVLQTLPSPLSLRLDGNPWACTCQIQHLWRWMNENKDSIKEKEAILCGLPGSRDRYPVLSIGEHRFSRCLENFRPRDYCYFFLIGLSLFMSSIVTCFMAGLAVIAYRHLLFKYKTRPHIYKKKTGAYENNVIIDDSQRNHPI